MVGYLGLPPPEYIQRSEANPNVFNAEGQWKGAGGTEMPPLFFGKINHNLGWKGERAISQLCAICVTMAIREAKFRIRSTTTSLDGRRDTIIKQVAEW
jgi:hypothetical protein